MGDLLKSLVQNSISSRTAPQVPFRQPLWPPCRCSTPMAQRKPLRMDFSSVGVLCQGLVIESGMFPNLCPIRRGYFISLDKKWGHSLSVCTLCCTLLFGALSVTLISIKRGLMVMNQPCTHRQLLVGLQGTHRPLYCLENCHQVSPSLDPQTKTAALP